MDIHYSPVVKKTTIVNQHNFRHHPLAEDTVRSTNPEAFTAMLIHFLCHMVQA
jgi:hypothetical protein